MNQSDARQQALRISALTTPATAAGLVISLPAGIFVTALLGPASWGALSLLGVMQRYFGYTHFGLQHGMGRQVPIALGRGNRREAKEMVNVAFSGTALTTAVSLGLLWLLYLLGLDFGGKLRLWVMVAVSALVALDRADSLLHTYAKAYGHFGLIARRQVFLRLLTPAIAVPAVATLHLPGAVLALVLTAAAGVTFYLLGLRSELRVRFQLPMRRIVALASVGGLVFANQYLAGLIDAVGLTILGITMSATEVGLVAFALGALAIAGELAGPFSNIVSRHMLLRRGAIGEGHQFEQFEKYMVSPFSAYVMLLALLQGAIYLGYTLMTRLFLPEFEAALLVLNILLLKGMLFAPTAYLQFYMNASNQLLRRLPLLGSVLGLNVLISLLLLRQGHGMSSVAWGATISHTIFAALLIGLAIRQTSGQWNAAASYVIRVLVAAGALTALAIALDAWTIAPFAQQAGWAPKIALGLLDVAPKVAIYAACCLGVFLLLFRDHALWKEVKEAVQYLASLAQGRLAVLRGSHGR